MISNVDEKFYPFKISQSEMYALLRCKKQWAYSYVEGLEPVGTPDYLTKGSFVHALMAKFLESLQSGKEFNFGEESLNIQREAILNDEPTVDEPTRQAVVEQLERFWKEVGTDGFEVVAVEEEFYVNMGVYHDANTVAPLHGIIDAVVRDSNTGDLWIIEHKTASRAWSTQQFESSYQGKLYCDAWERLTGERPIGIQYNFFYPNRFEIRHQYVSPEESELLNVELQVIVSMRSQLRNYGLFPREPLWGCNGCRFRDLCFTELAGGDDTLLRTSQFTVSDEKKERWKTT